MKRRAVFAWLVAAAGLAALYVLDVSPPSERVPPEAGSGGAVSAARGATSVATVTRLSGTISAASGGAIGKARVCVTHVVARGLPTCVESDAQGGYRIDALAPGMYTISAGAPGFITASARGGESVALRSGQQLVGRYRAPCGLTDPERKRFGRPELLGTTPGRYYASIRCLDHVFAAGPRVVDVGAALLEPGAEPLRWEVTRGADLTMRLIDAAGEPVARRGG